jgi:hypothetical protein
MNDYVTTAAKRPARPASGLPATGLLAVLVLVVGAACLATPVAADRRLPERARLPVPHQLAPGRVRLPPIVRASCRSQ